MAIAVDYAVTIKVTDLKNDELAMVKNNMESPAIKAEIAGAIEEISGLLGQDQIDLIAPDLSTPTDPGQQRALRGRNRELQLTCAVLCAGAPPLCSVSFCQSGLRPQHCKSVLTF